MDYLIWYNTEKRVHKAFQNKLGPPPDTIYDTMAEKADTRVADSSTYY